MSDYRTYAYQLLEAARTHRRYKSAITNTMVSASIIERFVAQTPLNKRKPKPLRSCSRILLC